MTFSTSVLRTFAVSGRPVPRTVNEIAERLQEPEPIVLAALMALVRAGLLRSAGSIGVHTIYEPTDQGATWLTTNARRGRISAEPSRRSA